MIVPFRQHTISGCASYTLANLFNDERYLRGVQDLKVGERTVDMNRKLEKYHPEYYIGELFVTSSTFTKQHNRLIDPLAFMYDPEETTAEQVETWARPLPIIFKRPTGMCHCILALHNLKDDLIYVFDSQHYEREIMDKFAFIENYHIIEVLSFGLWDHPKPENSMYCIKQHWPHLFEPGE